jgi:serine/threonine-protein kinase HipA
MQSLCAMRHFDFNLARAYSYEQAIETIRMLGLGREAIREQVRRALLNVFIRNQDDHTKNIAFLMDSSGRWSLSPAFDVVYAYNPDGDWTNEHQMSLAGKTDGFEIHDLLEFGKFADLKTGEVNTMIAEIRSAISVWDKLANLAGLPNGLAAKARAGFRTEITC